ncbi:isoprenylcysteine carboxylmethyltransferase family protein [Crocinitomicaceae bacterium CZZ-1]|uniref:Isoprenylcysteine carboxylmethyltransferase family protein n=1 Tax=Taishania pollutisoli TaxID=2766479 RepID=A0A8J6PIS0_9FLAO|nr:isoprenylcysteine carboxylmethyltransferase family protein [Taishania pollutisoli]MBC9812374.1 isoprenylcysteine carboxylmethyltransferase family protein [Taishania pollutisoli]
MKPSELLLNSFLGLLFLLCTMGAALFLSYGSFKYALTWLYLSIFACSVIAITVYLFLFDKHLLKSRLKAGPVSETRVTQKIIQSIAGLLFLGIFVLSALDYQNKWSNVPIQLSYTSDLVCALAFIFLFFVFKQNTFLSATIEVQEKQKVVSTGLYGIVRHPMYTGALALLSFTPTALGSYYGLLPVLIIAFVIAYRTIDEENELKQNLVGYKAYCEKVKYRLIPLLF